VRIGPHDLEDIALRLAHRQIAARKQEVLAAVAAHYPPHPQIWGHTGKALKP